MNINICFFTNDTEYFTELAQGLVKIQKKFSISIKSRESILECKTGEFDLYVLDTEKLTTEDSSQYFDFVAKCAYIGCMGTAKSNSEGLITKKLKIISKKHCYICKYDSIINIYRDIMYLLSLYGIYYNTEGISVNTRITGIASLGGCTGCTSVALTIGRQLASTGHTTLFLSMEQIVSNIITTDNSPYNIDYFIHYVFSDLPHRDLSMDSFMYDDIFGLRHFRYYNRHNILRRITTEELRRIIRFISEQSSAEHIIIDFGDVACAVYTELSTLCDCMVCTCSNNDYYSKSLASFELIRANFDAQLFIVNNCTRQGVYAEVLDEEYNGLELDIDNEFRWLPAELLSDMIVIPYDRASFNIDNGNRIIALEGVFGKKLKCIADNICMGQVL